ncbi:uncharacterized protein LOC115762344 [Drosophila novamexicana]|uniref:uncharacterized protein LOC115762344 n=1 Tax=Drosophila novamexicana TaxID=47314 RepID=UPI0011E5BBF8|nr:uncharacterized protein LOC115762344 [Drosophila novamexicana]
MRCAFVGIIYTSATCCCLWLLPLLPLLQQGEAMPWWRHNNNDANYDASLDPLVWSRAFVQDTVRRPRISQLEAAEVPQLDKHRRRWWSDNKFHNNNHNKKRKKSYKQYVRRHRKRLLLRQTRC